MVAFGSAPENQRLGDFEIVRELGRGGMGVVYEARQVSLNRKVALKVLSGGLGLTGKAVQRFRREAEAAAQLHHTNIVPVYATGEQDGVHYYAMELIEGPSLDQVLRQLRGPTEPATPAPLAQTTAYEPNPGVAHEAGLSASSLSSGGAYFDTVARMLAGVADALDHAHRQGVIHRDLKPGNLLLSPDGRLSLNDFGLARMLEQPGMTMTGEFVGTPLYMAPEQIAAGRVPIDHRADVYSLGATLYELLTLRPPFRGERRDQVIAQVLHKEPPAPRRLNPKVPVDLETICLKAMDKDPDRRYQTAGAMADDLRRYVNRFAISARRAGPLERLRKWVKRRPGLAAALAAVVVALGVAGFFAQQAWRDRHERIAAEQAARSRLLEEKMQQAQHDILQGDFPAAEEAIAAAEQFGAPQEWAQWRRGQIAYHRAQYEKAIALLEPAAARMPDNVALTCLLASAWYINGLYEEPFLIINRLDSLTPRTSEDFLYKGLAESILDGVKGLKTLDEAMARQPSLIAHVLRAEVRTDHALDTTDLTSIEGAVEDATAAKSILRGNPSALIASVNVQMHAAGLYAMSGKTKERDDALRVARNDAAELARFPELSNAVVNRGWFLQYDGQEEEAFKVFENGVRQKEVGTLVAWNYALELYRRGEAEKALKAIDSHIPASPYYRDYTRAIFLAELPNGPARAREIYDTLMAKHPALWLEWVGILVWLGNKEEASAAIRSIDPEHLPPWIRMYHDYLRNPGPAAEEKLLKDAGHSKRKQMHAHGCIGLMLLVDGDRSGARRHFEACLATHCFYRADYYWSRAFLGRMDRDPAWPMWIPAR
jgi:tetratricopeptide (TPR) repeat protein